MDAFLIAFRLFVGLISFPPPRDDVLPRIELLDKASVAKLIEDRVSSVLRHAKFRGQSGGVAVPESNSFIATPTMIIGGPSRD